MKEHADKLKKNTVNVHSVYCRRMDDERLDLPLEGDQPGSDGGQPVTAGRIQARRIWQPQLWCQDGNRYDCKIIGICFTLIICLFRRLQLPPCWADFRPPVVLLHRDHLRPLLHDRRRIVDVVLDRPQSGEHSWMEIHWLCENKWHWIWVCWWN